MKKRKALIVVDVQLDFMPGGSLAVPEGDKVVPVINKLLPEFDLVIFLKDWHDPEMEAFASQHEGAKPFDKYWPLMRNGSDYEPDTQETLWPDHCIANTPGADFHPDLDFGKCAKDFYIFKKGTEKYYHPYSGFRGTELKKFLDERGVTDVYITGLAGDYCCKDTAIDSVFNGFNTFFIMDAIKFISDNKTETLVSLYEANIKIIESYEINFLSI